MVIIVVDTVIAATISYSRRPCYYFDIHREDGLYHHHLSEDRKMGGNTLQPDDFVLNEVERKPEDAELKSDFRFCHDRRQWYLGQKTW